MKYDINYNVSFWNILKQKFYFLSFFAMVFAYILY